MTYRFPANEKIPVYGADASTENAWRHTHAVARIMIEALQDYPLGTIAILDHEELACFIVQAESAEHLAFVYIVEGQLQLENAVPLQCVQGWSIEELDYRRQLMVDWLQIAGRREGFWLQHPYRALQHCAQFIHTTQDGEA